MVRPTAPDIPFGLARSTNLTKAPPDSLAQPAALAGVVLTERIRRGVVQLPTGAWYDPVDPDEDKPLCVHGNPNVLTRDIGTSGAGSGLHRAAHNGPG